MPAALTCPHCGKVHQPRVDVAGRSVRCGRCRETFRAPGMMATRSVTPSAGPGSPLKLTCPCCGKVHELPSDVAGRKVRCGGCGEKYRMPKGEGPPVRIPHDDGTVILPGPIPPPREVAAEPPRAAAPGPRPVRVPEPEPDLEPESSSGFDLAAVEEAPPRPKPAAPRSPAPASAPLGRPRPGPAAESGVMGWVKTAVAALVLLAFIGNLSRQVYRRYIRTAPDGVAAVPASHSSPTAPASAPGPIAMPPLPEVGPGRAIEPGVVLHESRLPGGDAPGWGGKLWLYLPEGEHAPRSLPCVMITAAGSTLLTGNTIDEDSRPEHVPYVRAGFAVLAYDMDGDPGDATPNPSDARFGEAVRKFLAARAGLVNAHVAMEFLRAKVPQVDPDRIFAAGHSSAGTAALIFAEDEPRLKGCVAYAPATNLVKRFGPALPEIGANGWTDLLGRYSPMDEDRKRRLACPVFLFQAQGDDNVPAMDTEGFAMSLRSYGKDVRLETIPGGDHYRSMLDPGIPKAIEWLREVAARPAAPATPAPAPAAVATAKAPAPAPAAGPYVSEDGSFRATFPDPPRATVQDRRGPNGEVQSLHVTALDEGGVSRVVAWGATPARIATPADAEAAIDGAVRGMTAAGDRAVDRQSPVAVGPYAGRDVYFRIPRSPGHGGRGLSRLVIAGNRLYQVVMVGPEATVADADLEAFVRTFEFTEGIAAAIGRDARPAEAARPAQGEADRLVPMLEGRPVSLPGAAAGASIAGFRFVDAAQDRVGTGGESAGRPDGQVDMHFRVELDLPAGATVDQLSLAVDDDYHRWVTRPNDRFWFLGVERDGKPAIPGFAEPIGSFSGRQAFDLFGESDLPPGTAFRLGVALTVDGRPVEIGAVCTRP